MADRDETLIIGRIVGVFGVRGWLKVNSYTDPRENLGEYQPWRVGREARVLRVEGFKPHGKGLIAKLEGVDDRDAAAALIGRDIAIRPEQLPEAASGEYYWRDLIGLAVRDEQRQVDLGVVANLMETGGNDVLVVRDGNRERLIPFVKEWVRRVDLDQGVMDVDWDPSW